MITFGLLYKINHTSFVDDLAILEEHWRSSFVSKATNDRNNAHEKGRIYHGIRINRTKTYSSKPEHRNTEPSSVTSSTQHEKGRYISREITVFNRWDRIRYVCGRAIPANGTILFNLTMTVTDDVYIHGDHQDFCKASVDSTGKISLFSSTRVFSQDPVLSVSNASHKTNESESSRWNGPYANIAGKDAQISVPSVVLRFGAEVDYPVVKGQFRREACDVPCFVWDKYRAKAHTYIKFDGAPFQIKFKSMEGSGYYKDLVVDPRAHWNHEYYSTTSFESDIPLTYYSLPPIGDDLRTHPPVDFNTGIKGASFLARNCGSLNHREDLVEELIGEARVISGKDDSNLSRFRIDSLSTCVHHAPLGFPNGTFSNSTKKDIINKYIFHLAFENQNVDDYITEKLWWTLQSGAIPVYFGASNVLDHLPHPNSVIRVSDFAYQDTSVGKHNINTTALAEYLWKVANNRSLYDSHHAWRTLSADSKDSNGNGHSGSAPTPCTSNVSLASRNDRHYCNFLDKYAFTSTDSTCRICRFGYALQYGWGWDHRQQKIQELRLPSNSYGIPNRNKDSLPSPVPHYHNYNRSTCFLETTRQMVYPLREIWAGDEENQEDNEYTSMGTLDTFNRRAYRCHGAPNVSSHRVVTTVGSSTVVDDNNNFLRTIRDHDGVTDMEITRQSTMHSSAKTLGAEVTVDGSSVSSFRLVTPFANATELILVKRHMSYRAASEWRNENWKRYATASNKKARKRILPYESQSRFWEERGALVWIQDQKSRIVLMANSPNAFLPALQAAGSNSNANIDNRSKIDRFYDTLLLELPGTIEITLPAESQSLRLRWFVEDVDTFSFHSVDGNDEEENEFLRYGKETYFSSFMVDEFFHPLEITGSK